jgi:hypothetical protein
LADTRVSCAAITSEGAVEGSRAIRVSPFLTVSFVDTFTDPTIPLVSQLKVVCCFALIFPEASTVLDSVIELTVPVVAADAVVDEQATNKAEIMINETTSHAVFLT